MSRTHSDFDSAPFVFLALVLAGLMAATVLYACEYQSKQKEAATP